MTNLEQLIAGIDIGGKEAGWLMLTQKLELQPIAVPGDGTNNAPRVDYRVNVQTGDARTLVETEWDGAGGQTTAQHGEGSVVRPVKNNLSIRLVRGDWALVIWGPDEN